MKKNSGSPNEEGFDEQSGAPGFLYEGATVTAPERNFTQADAAQAKRLHLAKQSRKRGLNSLTAFTAEKNRPIKLKRQPKKANLTDIVSKKQNLEALFEAEITTAPTLEKNKLNKDSLLDISFIGLGGRRGAKTYLVSFLAFLLLVGLLMFAGYQTWRHFIFTPVPSKAWADKMGDAMSSDGLSKTTGVGEKLDVESEKLPEADLPARGIKKYYQSANRFPQVTVEVSPTPRPSLTPTPTPRATTAPFVVPTTAAPTPSPTPMPSTTPTPTTAPTTPPTPTTAPTPTPTPPPTSTTETTAAPTTSTMESTASPSPTTEPTTAPSTSATTEPTTAPVATEASTTAATPALTPDPAAETIPNP